MSALSYTCPICKKSGKPDALPCEDCHKAGRVPLAHSTDFTTDRGAELMRAQEELKSAKLAAKHQPEEPIFCECGEVVPTGEKVCPNCDEPFEFEDVLVAVEEARDKLQLAIAEALITLLAKK